MLLKLFVENFKSFNAPQEFSMVSGKKLKDKRDHKIETKYGSVLKNSVIFGANASGKSSFINVFDFIKKTTINGLSLNCNNYFCKIYPENKEKESYFEIVLIIDEKCYSFSFKVLFQKRIITYESLDLITTDNSKLNIYTRSLGELITLGKGIKLNLLEKNRFDIYTKDFVGNVKKLFLTSMVQGKNYEKDSNFYLFKKVYMYLTNKIIVLDPHRGITSNSLYESQESLENINKLIRYFDTGIDKIRPRTITSEELKRKTPPRFLEKIISTVKQDFKRTQSNEAQITCRINKNFFNIIIKNEQEPIITTISLTHPKSVFDFEFSEESDGTQRIFDLIDILLTQRRDTVYVIDELERSLHPLLTKEFIKQFMVKYADISTQLIFTTHEDYIMDLDCFRKDEIWFTQKKLDGSTKMYVLNDFGERYDKKIKNAYMKGEYEAIPIFKEEE